MNAYHLRTQHGTLVCSDLDRGVLTHGEVGPGHVAVVLVVPAPCVGVLVVHVRGGLAGLAGEPATSVELRAWRVQEGHALGNVRLVDPVTGLLMAAEPGGTVATNRVAAGLWETFGLVEVEAAAIDAPGNVIAALESLSARFPSAEELVYDAGLAVGLWPVAVTRAVLFAMPGWQRWLAALLLANPAAARRLGDTLDPWLTIGLPALTAWVAGSREGHARSIGPDLDYLAYMPMDARVGRQCVSVLRRQVMPRRSACVVATARNEGVYLVEWIAYHRAIGFEHFFIYSNDNDDASDALLEALAEAGVITWIRNRLGAPLSPQLKAYSHALGLLPDVLDFEWALIVDTDEFLVLDASRFGSVQAYAQWASLRHADAIALSWLVYGTFGQSSCNIATLVTERCTMRNAGVDMHVKTLCRPQMFMDAFPHYPRPGPGGSAVFRDSDGEAYEPRAEEFAWSAEPRDTSAWVNHYWSRSIAEVLVKFARNRGDMPNVGERSTLEVVRDIAERVVAKELGASPVEDRRLAACASGLPGERSGLLFLPGVSAAVAAIEARFVAKVATLRERVLALDTASMTDELRAVVEMVRRV